MALQPAKGVQPTRTRSAHKHRRQHPDAIFQAFEQHSWESLGSQPFQESQHILHDKSCILPKPEDIPWADWAQHAQGPYSDQRLGFDSPVGDVETVQHWRARMGSGAVPKKVIRSHSSGESTLTVSIDLPNELIWDTMRIDDSIGSDSGWCSELLGSLPCLFLRQRTSSIIKKSPCHKSSFHTLEQPSAQQTVAVTPSKISVRKRYSHMT